MKKIILTCEHGGNKVPSIYKNLFANHRTILEAHRGLDIGALAIAKDMQKLLKSKLHFSKITRLLVDLNRFRQSNSLFSEISTVLSDTEKETILKKYYEPHWAAIEKHFNMVHRMKNEILHVAVHSMTDNLNGKIRRMQLALLYDPRRTSEKQFSSLWISELRRQFPDYKITRNNPYKGADEGVTCHFRKRFNEKAYVGIELEINQGLLLSFTKHEREAFSYKLTLALNGAVKKFAD